MLLRDPSMLAVKAKNYEVLYNQSSPIALVKHLVIGQRQNAPNFSVFHWSPHGSLNGFHWSAFHNHEGTCNIFTEKGRSGPKHRMGPGCASCA